MNRNDYFKLLRSNPNFSYLWMAQVVSLLGDWFNTIALSTLVARYSGGSGLAISLYLMARFLPPLLISPAAGVIVDRFDRKRILILSNLFRVGVVLLFLFATTPDTLWLIYTLTIIQFSLSAFFEPGQSAIIPSLVRREDLVTANTLASVTWSVMLAFGAIIGGVVATLFGTAVALVIDALTFAVAASLIALIKVPARVTQPEAEPNETGSFVEGLRYFVARPAAAAAMLIKGGSSVGNVDALITVYATQIFIVQMSSQLSLGIMYAAFGVGAILGPALLNRFTTGSVMRLRYLVVLGFVWGFVGWIMLGLAESLLFVSLALIVRAMGGSVNWTYSNVIIQESLPDRYLGRAFALDLGCFQLATVTSILAHGLLVDLLRADNVSAVFMAPFASYFTLPSNFIRLDELSLIAFGTAVVSMLPMLLWMAAVRRMAARRAAYVPGD